MFIKSFSKHCKLLKNILIFTCEFLNKVSKSYNQTIVETLNQIRDFNHKFIYWNNSKSLMFKAQTFYLISQIPSIIFSNSRLNYLLYTVYYFSIENSLISFRKTLFLSHKQVTLHNYYGCFHI